MKKNIISLTIAAALSTLIVGCASVAVTDDAIEKNTAFALGVDKSQVTITNRENDGIKTTYNAKTTNGKTYACYVTGSVSVVGRVVSDAVCNETTAGAQSKPTKPDSSCNALLKAAGKCS